MTGLGQTLRGEARDALIFTGSNLLNRVGALILLPLYWTRLSPEDYGVIAVISIIGAFQSLASTLSLDLAITRFFYEWDEGTRRRNLGAIWTWNWLIATVVTVGFLVVTPSLGAALFPEVRDRDWLLLGIIGNSLANLFVVPASTIRIRRLPWLFATYNIIGFGTGTALGLWLVLVQDQGLSGYLLSVIGSNAVLALIGTGAMLRYASPGFSAPGLPEAIRFSLGALPASVINTLASVVDRLLLGLLTNLQTLGLYSVATRFADVISVLHNSMKMAFSPFLMKNITRGGEDGRRLVAAVTPYYLIPYFVAAVGLSLLIGPFVRWVNQPEYLGIEGLVPWLVGAGVLGSLYFYYCNGMFFAKRTELLIIPALVNLVVVAATNLLLIPSFGVVGLIVSRYAAAGTFLGLAFFLSQRAFPLPHRWAPLVRLAGAAALLTIVGQVLTFESLVMETTAKGALVGVFAVASLYLIDRDHPWSRALRALTSPRQTPDGALPTATEITMSGSPPND